MILDEAEALLDPVSDIDGFMLACLVDASTGMVLASRKDQDDISLPTAAAGAADIANVLSLLAGQLPAARGRCRSPGAATGSSTSGTGRSRTPNRTGRHARRRTPVPSRRRTCRR